MSQIVSGGQWRQNRLRHLRELREQASNDDERRQIDQEIEQLRSEAGIGRRIARALLPGMH